LSKTLKIILVIFLIPSFSWGDMHSDEIVISCKGDQGYNYKTEEEFKEFTEYKYHIVFFEDERGVVVQTSRFDMSAKGTYTDSTISASDEGELKSGLVSFSYPDSELLEVKFEIPDI